MKKFAALDLGDKWIGIATADPMGIVTTPVTTVTIDKLYEFLETFIKEQMIGTIIVGLPITLRGTESEQTKKIKIIFEQLQKRFPTIIWKLFDERFTSQHAESIKPIKTKEDKLKSHAIAAALILNDYLESERNKN